MFNITEYSYLPTVRYFFHNRCDKVVNCGDIYYLIYNPISSLVREENRLVSKIIIVMISECWVYKHKKSHFKLRTLFRSFRLNIEDFLLTQVPSMDITLRTLKWFSPVITSDCGYDPWIFSSDKSYLVAGPQFSMGPFSVFKGYGRTLWKATGKTMTLKTATNIRKRNVFVHW